MTNEQIKNLVSNALARCLERNDIDIDFIEETESEAGLVLYVLDNIVSLNVENAPDYASRAVKEAHRCFSSGEFPASSEDDAADFILYHGYNPFHIGTDDMDIHVDMAKDAAAFFAGEVRLSFDGLKAVFDMPVAIAGAVEAKDQKT